MKYTIIIVAVIILFIVFKIIRKKNKDLKTIILVLGNNKFYEDGNVYRVKAIAEIDNNKVEKCTSIKTFTIDKNDFNFEKDTGKAILCKFLIGHNTHIEKIIDYKYSDILVSNIMDEYELSSFKDSPIGRFEQVDYNFYRYENILMHKDVFDKAFPLMDKIKDNITNYLSDDLKRDIYDLKFDNIKFDDNKIIIYLVNTKKPEIGKICLILDYNLELISIK